VWYSYVTFPYLGAFESFPLRKAKQRGKNLSLILKRYEHFNIWPTWLRPYPGQSSSKSIPFLINKILIPIGFHSTHTHEISKPASLKKVRSPGGQSRCLVCYTSVLFSVYVFFLVSFLVFKTRIENIGAQCVQSQWRFVPKHGEIYERNLWVSRHCCAVPSPFPDNFRLM